MTFAAEHNLLYLWLLLPLLYLFYLGQRALHKRLQRFAATSNLAHLYRPPAHPRARYLLLALVFALLVFALAQPRFGFEWVEREQTGRDIYVVLDVSRSMLATDITPNRLQRAKRKLADLLSMLEGDRLSLIAFAGAAFVQCPLTVDYAAAQLFLDHLHPSLIPVRGTAIGAALQLALRSVEKSSPPEGAAIILITDGEDQGTEPLAAARRAKAAGVKIFVIGIGGAEGAPIPALEGGFVKDAQGDLVLTRLDEKTLQEIALITDGVYVRSVSGDFDLQHVYQRGIRQQIDITAQGQSRKKIWHEHFHLLLIAALLLLVLEFLLTRRLRLSLLCLCLLPSTGKAQDGHQLFEQKKYQESAQAFLKQEIENPADLEAVYNRAVSQFHAGDYAEAASGFAKAAQAQEPQLANRARFNLGNSHVAQQRLPAAQRAYEELLQRDPHNQKAAENLAWVKEQIKKQQQQQNQNENNNGQQQQNQNENKKQQQQQNQNENNNGQQQQQQNQNENNNGQQQASKAQQQENAAAQEQEAHSLSAEEVERLLRQLESDRIGVRPRNLQPAPKQRQQDW